MSRIFLGHSSANEAEAIAVNDWLSEQGWNDVFLDLDPERGIKAGQRWQAELKKAGGVAAAQVARGWLGVDVVDVTKAEAHAFKWDSPHGAKIAVATGNPVGRSRRHKARPIRRVVW